MIVDTILINGMPYDMTEEGHGAAGDATRLGPFKVDAAAHGALDTLSGSITSRAAVEDS